MVRSVRVRRPATLASLAAELGVSRTTVSSAYNRPDQLSPELRARVLEMARRLGYPGPDPVARSLRTRKAGAVGLLLTETLSYAFRDPAAVAFLEGLALACEETGHGLLLVPVGPESEGHRAVAVHRAGVDGFIVYSVPEDDPHLAAVLQRRLPMVICDQPDIDGIDSVGIDDHAAMVELGRHLTGLGHRRVGAICMRLGRDRYEGPVDLARQHSAHFHVQRRRLAGLADAFGAVGVEWESVPVVERFEHTVAAGASAAAELLEANPSLTALACTSDILGLGALTELRRRGLRVPQDVTVTGFDGVSEAERAGLTTVRQPVRDKGRAAGRLLADPMMPATPRRVVLPTELVVAATSGPAREIGTPWFSGL